MADDFCRFFDAMMAKYTLMSSTRRNYYHASAMQKNEVTPVMILFHASDCRCIKHYMLSRPVVICVVCFPSHVL